MLAEVQDLQDAIDSDDDEGTLIGAGHVSAGKQPCDAWLVDARGRHRDLLSRVCPKGWMIGSRGEARM
eukprot:760972-Hanusia_phi.AAC.2